jgi:HSP20 family protein
MKTLMPWRPGFGMFGPFHREMDALIERFFGKENGEREAIQEWAPRVDVEETDKEILVKADLPGVDPKDVEIQVVDGMLTIKGEKKEEKEEKKKDYHRVERFFGKFYRAIPIPPGADAEKVAATSAKGVVTVTIPKKPEAQPKNIAVKAQA